MAGVKRSGEAAARKVASDTEAHATGTGDLAVAPPIERLLALPPEAAARTGFRVTGPATGRRRAGMLFGPVPIVLPLVDLGEGELRAIDADPLLSWALVEMPDTAEVGEL